MTHSSCSYIISVNRRLAESLRLNNPVRCHWKSSSASVSFVQGDGNEVRLTSLLLHVLGQYKTTDYNVVDTGVWIVYRHHSTVTLRYTGQMAIFHSFLPSPGYTCRKEPAQLSACTIEISTFRKDNVLNFGVLRLMFISSTTCPPLLEVANAHGSLGL